MKIARIQIENVLGTRKAEFAPGTVTVISGANGTGKSSILRALLALFEGGHDPTLIRKGMKRGVIRAELDTGTVITKAITPTATNIEIIDANGLTIPSPRKFMQQLGESMAVDPSELLSIDATTAAGRKALMKALLDVMPVSFNVSELAEALKPAGLEWREALDLDGFGNLRKSLEDTRRKIGVEARDAEGTVADLSRLLEGADDAKDWKAQAQTLQAARVEIESAEAGRIAGVEADVQAEREGILSDVEKAIEAERVRHEEESAKIRAYRNQKLEELLRQKDAAIAEIRVEFAGRRDSTVAALSEAKEKAAQQERTAGAKDTIERMRKRCKEKNTEYRHLTSALEALDAAKASKLTDLPITGLEFDGETVLVDGIEWQNVNTERRAEIALQFCTLRCPDGGLPFLILDDSQDFDSAHWEAVKHACVAAGFQIVAARVSESGPLRIETESEEAPVA